METLKSMMGTRDGDDEANVSMFETDSELEEEENNDIKKIDKKATIGDMQMFYGDIATDVDKRKECLIYPNDTYKIYWDIFIVILLVIACSIIPFRMAFIS